MSENSFKTWMADLPQETTCVPLCSMAIPGKKYNNKRETTLVKLLVTIISESFYTAWNMDLDILSTYSIFVINAIISIKCISPPPPEGPN